MNNEKKIDKSIGCEAMLHTWPLLLRPKTQK